MKVYVDAKEFEKLDKELEYLKTHELIVGIISEDFPDVGKKTVTIKMYAIFNEYGTVKIPARPFFRRATQSRKSKRIITEYMEKQINLVIEGKKTAKQALDATGLFVSSRIKISIKKGNWQSNSAKTIKKKGNKPPLIDTSSLIKSISYEIRRK